MTPHEQAIFVNLFGATPVQLLSAELSAKATHEARMAAGFAGMEMTSSQQEMWMNTFGKTPLELPPVFPQS